MSINQNSLIRKIINLITKTSQTSLTHRTISLIILVRGSSAPVCMWFDYGVLNDFLKEWVVRMDELKSGEITRDEYFEWKINWPQTCDGCGKFEPKRAWRKEI